jgi:hypothetical protein
VYRTSGLVTAHNGGPGFMKRRRTKLAAPDARSISGSGRGPTSARTDPMAHRALVGALALLAWDARSRDQPQHSHQLVRPERQGRA